MTFALDIKDFAKKTGQNIQDVKAIVALDMFGKVVMATPVGNPILWETPRAPAGYVGGRLRGNWQASRNTPIKTTTSRIDASGEETIKSISTTVEKATGDDSIFISNNLPYAVRVEYGHSKKQRPQGMVRVTLLAFQAAIDEAIRSVVK